MAWTAPPTYTAGAILTAAQMNAISANLLAGGPVYSNETARDAAIPSPFEGQRAYITGSTVAAATGTTTAVPTGIKTVYNGSAWVCVTEVAARSDTSASTTSTSYVTTLTGDATALSVTLATGTTALITGHCTVSPSTAATMYGTISVSGATTIAAASSAYASGFAQANGSYTTQFAWAWIVTGLTAGTNTFTLNYATSAGTATYTKRTLVAKGIA